MNVFRNKGEFCDSFFIGCQSFKIKMMISQPAIIIIFICKTTINDLSNTNLDYTFKNNWRGSMAGRPWRCSSRGGSCRRGSRTHRCSRCRCRPSPRTRLVGCRTLGHSHSRTRRRGRDAPQQGRWPSGARPLEEQSTRAHMVPGGPCRGGNTWCRCGAWRRGRCGRWRCCRRARAPS